MNDIAQVHVDTPANDSASRSLDDRRARVCAIMAELETLWRGVEDQGGSYVIEARNQLRRFVEPDFRLMEEREEFERNFSSVPAHTFAGDEARAGWVLERMGKAVCIGAAKVTHISDIATQSHRRVEVTIRWEKPRAAADCDCGQQEDN